jgi:hypothetical protein
MQINNVYIIGRVEGNYRTQNLIKLFLDAHINLSYDTITIETYIKQRNINGLIAVILRKIQKIIKFFPRVYKLWVSDLVILPAMCNYNRVEFKIAKFFNKKIITDFYISYYDTFVLDRGEISMQSAKAKKLYKWDKKFIEDSTCTIFLNTSEAKYYTKLLNTAHISSKHKIVPLVIEESFKCDLPYFNSENHNNIFNICWWGTYIPLHGLEKIIESCLFLKEIENFKFHLYLFGTNAVKAQPYIDLIEKNNLSHVITLKNDYTFKNGKLNAFLKKHCDLVLGNFGDSPKAKNVLVNKLIDGVAMKAPVLTGESIAPREFFSQNAIFYSMNNPKAIANNIYNISQKNTSEIEGYINNAYKVYENHFSVTAFTNKMKTILNEL